MRGANYQFSGGDLKFDSSLVNEKFKYEHPNHMIMQCSEIVTKRSKAEILQMFNPSLRHQKMAAIHFFLWIHSICGTMMFEFPARLWHRFEFREKTKTLKEGFFERATQNMWEFIQNKLALNFHLLFLSSSFSVGSGDYRVCNSSLPDIMNVEMVALRKVTKE